MNATPIDEESIFQVSRKIDAPEVRQAYLDQVCGADRGLRERLEALLRVHDQERSFLGAPPADLSITADADVPPLIEGPRTNIGPYKLLEPIGEGGMGSVYLAEQAHPIRRRVALKVIKPGMDSQQVIARFEVERQALALMDHPHIARVIDAGTTDAGRPYFVMDLVKGVPITEYCDQNRLTPQQRLELFISVCQAIQHAHQKGIIHRDIKPSNVLVTLQDANPVPKVIDFGIAKAIDQRLTERTLFTQFGAVVGTPEYMSPEQAGMSGLDIDTRSDIYSLGVLLYELLTGSTPLRRETLRAAGFDEILRRIREEEPPRPSTRLSHSTDTLPSISARRHIEPARLTKLVRGELDWIVMKALEKDRTRRYETASGLARDVERYLNGEPVEAGPPSAAYKLKKYALKHRAGLATAVGFAVVLVAATVISSWLAIRAARAAQRERQALDTARERLGQIEKANDLLASIFRDLDPDAEEKQGKPLRAILGERLDRAAEQLDSQAIGDPLTVAKLQHILGRTQLSLGFAQEAIALAAKARRTREQMLGPDHPHTLSSRNVLAIAYRDAGQTAEAIVLYQETLKLATTKLGPDHPSTLASRNNLALAYLDAGQTAEAIALHQETLKLTTAKLGPDHPNTLDSRNNLANAYQAAGRTAEAIALLEENLKLRTAKLGPEHSKTLPSRRSLANAYLAAGQTAEAIALHQETLKLATTKLGPDHPHTLASRGALAWAYVHAGRTAEAIAMYEETLKLMTAKLGPEHPDTLKSRDNLAWAYQAAGRTAEAIALHQETLKLMTAKLGPDHPDTLASRSNLASAYQDAGQTAEAIALHQETLKLMTAKLGPDHPNTLASRHFLAAAALDAGRTAEAIALLEENLKLTTAKLGPEHPQTLVGRQGLACAYHAAGRTAEAIAMFQETLKLMMAKLGPEHPQTLTCRNSLANAYLDAGRFSEAIAMCEETLRLRMTNPGPDHPDTLSSRNNLANAYLDAGRTAEAIALLEEALKLMTAKLGPDHPKTLASHDSLANAYLAAGRLPEAIARNQETFKLMMAKLGPGHPYTLASHNSLAHAYLDAGRLPEAIALHEEALKLRTAKLGPDHPDTLISLNNLSRAYLAAGLFARSEPILRQCLAIRERTQPEGWWTFHTRSQLGGSLLGQKKFAEAEPLILQGYEGMEARQAKIPAPSQRRLAEAGERVVKLYEAWGKKDKAAEWRRKLGKGDDGISFPADPFAR
jgi:serine/threonine protein kinase/tetratricopeptide (TPR) repeat protein